MKKIMNWVVSCILAMAFMGGALAQERGTTAEAKALLEKAMAHLKSTGNEKAFADFTAKDGKWQNKDLYVFVIKFDGETVAHGANQGLVGKNLMDLKDANGTQFIKEMVEAAKAKGTGAVDYMFTDPATKKVAPKTSYINRIPGFEGFAGVGVYKQ